MLCKLYYRLILLLYHRLILQINDYRPKNKYISLAEKDIDPLLSRCRVSACSIPSLMLPHLGRLTPLSHLSRIVIHPFYAKI